MGGRPSLPSDPKHQTSAFLADLLIIFNIILTVYFCGYGFEGCLIQHIGVFFTALKARKHVLCGIKLLRSGGSVTLPFPFLLRGSKLTAVWWPTALPPFLQGVSSRPWSGGFRLTVPK